MAKKPRKEQRERKPPGPEASHLKIEGDWEEAVAEALKKKPAKDAEPKPKAAE